jgi:deoxyribose-phosphate aldolase
VGAVTPEVTAELARRAIRLLDLTNLDDRCDVNAVDVLCARAAEHAVAAVCVWPDFVAQAAVALSGTGVRVATVVNFPTGDERAFATSVLTARAVDDGAREIDVVLPYKAFLAGDGDRVVDVVRAARLATAGTADLKVILETGELPDQATVAAAARAAIDEGADFVKTSTGKSRVSATPQAAATMLDVIAATDRSVGIKPSGGIRSAEDAAVYLGLAADKMGDEWATPATFRFGASSLLDALLAVR